METLKLFAVLVLAVIVSFFGSVVPGHAQTTAATEETQPLAAVASPAPPAKVVELKLSEILKKRVPKGVPVLEDIAVTAPDRSVSSELTEFSGAWVGEWHGERTNAHMADQLVVFEKVSPTSVTVVSAGIGRFVGGSYSNYGETWSRRSDLRPEHEGTPLVVTAPNGNRVTYEVKGGKLKARSVTPSGVSWIGTFEKIQ